MRTWHQFQLFSALPPLQELIQECLEHLATKKQQYASNITQIEEAGEKLKVSDASTSSPSSGRVRISPETQVFSPCSPPHVEHMCGTLSSILSTKKYIYQLAIGHTCVGLFLGFYSVPLICVLSLYQSDVVMSTVVDHRS
jgi:hypothetical protein